jgi:decaprenyl-phosphate phosphoribosyltransferase
MGKLLYYLLKTARPRQWVKNFALFAALLFSGFLFSPSYFAKVLEAFVVFCGLASAIYIINDMVDAEQDRKHPFKKKRPIASGKLPIPIALLAAITLLFIVLVWAWNLSFFFFLICFIYLLLNLAYTQYLKMIPILDLITIASFYTLRVYAGALVVNLHMNVWFLLTVISIALFLAVGKRQSERTLLTGLVGGLAGQRAVLSAYSVRLLDIYTGMFASATWLTYALFAFQERLDVTDGPIPTFLSQIPQTFVSEKWLMITVPVVIYGVMRYLQLIYEKNQGESPERVLLTDMPLLTSVILWTVLTIGIVYGIG